MSRRTCIYRKKFVKPESSIDNLASEIAKRIIVSHNITYGKVSKPIAADKALRIANSIKPSR